MSRVLKGFKALLASSSEAAATSGAAAKFSSAAAATAKSATSKAAKKAPKKPTTSKTNTEKPATPRSSGIFKVTAVSPALGQFLGAQQASRTEAVKQIWTYIKSHNLQNPSNKREIFCDEKLKTIFDGKEKVGFLEIGKMLSHHFVKTT
ncbi:hypothetical protein PTKIN_Ptkin06aG0142300 [Pterospermum kingtungense]